MSRKYYFEDDNAEKGMLFSFDLEEHDKQTIYKFLMWLYHKLNVTMIGGITLNDLVEEYEKDIKGE